MSRNHPLTFLLPIHLLHPSSLIPQTFFLSFSLSLSLSYAFFSLNFLYLPCLSFPFLHYHTLMSSPMKFLSTFSLSSLLFLFQPLVAFLFTFLMSYSCSSPFSFLFFLVSCPFFLRLSFSFHFLPFSQLVSLLSCSLFLLPFLLLFSFLIFPVSCPHPHHIPPSPFLSPFPFLSVNFFL